MRSSRASLLTCTRCAGSWKRVSHSRIETRFALADVAYGIDSSRVNSVCSEIMSLFNPDKDTRNFVAVEDLKRSVSAATEKACSSITMCLSDQLSSLMKSGPQTRDELLAIVKDAAEIAV